MAFIINILKQIAELLTELCRLITLIVFILFIGLFSIANIINSLYPQMSEKNFLIMIVNSDINNFLIALLIILLISIFISFKRKKFRFILPFSLTKEEIIIYALSAYFLAFFIAKNLHTIFFLGKYAYLVIALGLFFFLPQITEFYLQFRFNHIIKIIKSIQGETKYLKIKIQKIKPIKIKPFAWRTFLASCWEFFISWLQFFYRVRFYLLILIGSVIGVFSLVVIILWSINNNLRYLSNLRRQLIIAKIKPNTTTIGEKVTIEGYNFGFKENQFFQVRTNQGLVTDIKDWNNNKVEFIVPLSFKEGQIKLWLERTKEASTKSALLKSNQVDLEILSRWYFYPQAKEFSYPPSIISWVKTLKKRFRRIILLKYNWTNFIR